MRNNPNLDPVNVNEYAKFGLILLICSQDTERKRTQYDELTDKLKTVYPPHGVMMLYKMIKFSWIYACS